MHSLLAHLTSSMPWSNRSSRRAFLQARRSSSIQLLYKATRASSLSTSYLVQPPSETLTARPHHTTTAPPSFAFLYVHQKFRWLHLISLFFFLSKTDFRRTRFHWHCCGLCIRLEQARRGIGHLSPINRFTFLHSIVINKAPITFAVVAA